MLANARLATVARKAIRFTAVLLVLLELSARTDDNPYQWTKSSPFPRGHKTIQTLPVAFFLTFALPHALRQPGHPCFGLFHAGA